MMCIKRTIVALTFLSLLMPGFGGVGRSQASAAAADSKKTFTISGMVGLAGVVMRGLPGDPITDNNGFYAVTVAQGWAGSVKPTKPGYTFEPQSRIYEFISRDYKTEDYTPKTITYTISGNAGMAGVVMKGLPSDPVTDGSGAYKAEVPYSWKGKITPSKEGYEFSPPSLDYRPVTADCERQDYVAKVLTFAIAGNAGVAEAAIIGLPGDPATDASGQYSAEVHYGWTGMVVPKKDGYLFEPAKRMYQKVTRDLRNEDFTARVRMVTISDWIRAGNEPIMEVKVTADPGGQSVLTDLQGRYAIQVPYGWSGRLIHSKDGFVFDPDSRPFTNVTADIIGQEPAPSGTRPTPPSRTQAYPRAILPSPAGNVFVIPTTQVAPQKFAETADDLRVMLQIFREKLSEPRMVRGAFVDFGDFFGDRDRALEAFYLQGSAAVFVLEMGAPFSFSPPQTGEGQATQENVDVVWQRARQKLYAPQDPARGPAGPSGETERMDFQQFKEDLFKTFRHAANLRNVEPNESVVLTIIAHDESAGWPSAPVSVGGSYGGGGGTWFEGSSSSTSSNSFGPSGGSTYADSRTRSSGSMAGRDAPGRAAPGSAPATSATVLTIQAKKADIDALARGSLSFEQFQQRVRSFTY